MVHFRTKPAQYCSSNKRDTDLESAINPPHFAITLSLSWLRVRGRAMYRARPKVFFFFRISRGEHEKYPPRATQRNRRGFVVFYKSILNHRSPFFD